METHEDNLDRGSRPTPEEADAALRDAEWVRSGLAAAPLPVPWWYFPALAAYMAGIALAQLLPQFWAIGITIGIAAAIGATAGYAFRQSGYIPKIRLRDMWLVMVLALALVIGGLVLDQRYNQQWVWYVVAALNVCLVLGVGVCYQRAMRKARP